MLQSAIFADLQVNNFGIPTVRLTPRLPLIRWTRVSFASLFARLGHGESQASLRALNAHLRRDIGLLD